MSAKLTLSGVRFPLIVYFRRFGKAREQGSTKVHAFGSIGLTPSTAICSYLTHSPHARLWNRGAVPTYAADLSLTLLWVASLLSGGQKGGSSTNHFVRVSEPECWNHISAGDGACSPNTVHKSAQAARRARTKSCGTCPRSWRSLRGLIIRTRCALSRLEIY